MRRSSTDRASSDRQPRASTPRWYGLEGRGFKSRRRSQAGMGEGPAGRRGNFPTSLVADWCGGALRQRYTDRIKTKLQCKNRSVILHVVVKYGLTTSWPDPTH